MSQVSNVNIADSFEQVADLLEFQGANPFRIRAYRNGARTIRDLPESVASIVTDATQKLTDIDGIGKDLAEKCKVFVEKGELPQLQLLLEEVPSTVLDLLRIPNLGPKKAKILFTELGLSTLEALQSACESGQVRQLKGFGEKTEASILHGIEIASLANQRILWIHADEIAEQLHKHMSTCDKIERMEFAGSYRRGRETIGDLDLLVVSSNTNQVMDHFGAFPEISEIIARGETKMSIRFASGLAVDLRVVGSDSFGAALQYFTGSKDHNVVLRGLAKRRGLKINEYGVFNVKDNREEYVAGAEENDVYATLNLPTFPPEMREARCEFEWAEQDKLPKLVQETDILGDLHMHTNATDGKVSLHEMAEAAIQRGLKYIAITDHSQRVSMARGLDTQRLIEQWNDVDRINDEMGNSLTVLKGLECDILERGGMDLPDDVLARGDWILASIHYGQNQPREQITDRLLEAIENPYISAIAHPTGRLIQRRDPYDADMDQIFTAARKHGTLLELNANPHRLDLHDVHCATAKSHGIPVVISTDAHSVAGLNFLRCGVLQARRAGLEKQDVANTRPWPELKKLIESSE